MRKYIDIINEFSSEQWEKDHGGFNTITPDEDGGGRDKTVVITDIIWDMDPEEAEALGLPNRASASLGDVEDAADPYADEEYKGDMMHMIGDWLTSNYDSRLSNFNYRIII